MWVATYRERVPMRWVVKLYMILCLANPGWGTVASLLERGNSLLLDGDARNGIYTKHLLRYITKSQLAVEQMFKQVRIAVQEETHGQHTPWESSLLLGDFFR